jgi:aminopeptidase-like protein
MMNLIAYTDGKHDLLDIAEIIGVYVGELIPLSLRLKEKELLKEA